MNVQPNIGLTELGARVRKRRLELGYSQEQLAEACGFDRTYISMVERGKRNLSFLNLQKIAIGLQLKLSCLLGE